MEDEERSREDLLAELKALRCRVAELLCAQDNCRLVEAALRESEERYRRLLESVTDYIYTVRVEDCRPVATTHGPSCVTVTGYTAAEYDQSPLLWISMVSEEDRQAVLDQAQKLQAGIESAPLEHRILHKDGTIRWVRNTTVLRRDADGRVTGYDGIINDITERRLAEEEIRRLSLHDALTGLPNRQLFADRLKMAAYRVEREGGKVAVFFIDLDHFKAVNDSFGHAVGDALLVSVARRLIRHVRRMDTVARLGGDEFVVMAPDLQKAEDAGGMAAAVVHSLAQPFLCRGCDCRIGASVGIALFPDDSRNPEALLQLADTAMYRVKKAGRNGYQFYKDIPVTA